MLLAMTLPTKRTTAALGAAVVLASSGLAIGSQSGDGNAAAQGTTTTPPATTTPAKPERRGRDLSGAAQQLGVTEEKLRTALDELRDELPRPDRDRGELTEQLASELGIPAAKVESALRAQRPRRGDREGREDRHAAIAAALAKELELDAAKVRAAFEAVHDDRGGRRDRDRPGHVAALARELGVSAERLRAAFAKVKPARGPFGGDVAALAQAMGVETAKLEAALTKVRAAHEAEHEQRRTAFAKALAGKLGIAQAKVEEVLGEGGPGPGLGGRGRGHGGPFGGGRHGGHR